MTTGTKSLLFGVHQFAWHPLTVWIAWVRLYREIPGWRETISILIHDWGYWGAPEMDGPVGSDHPKLGARIAGQLFGPWYRDLCLYHSGDLSRRHGVEPSKLCWPDKFSMLYDPTPFYLFRARLSGELLEYRKRASDRAFVPLDAPDIVWHRALVNHARAKAEKRATEIRGVA